jgi:hypothetical protein
MALVRAAADGARRYLARPDIFHLHGLPVRWPLILAAHIPATDGAAALAQVHAEHAALYAATEPVTHPHPASLRGSELAVPAVRSLDPHQVKLVEACRRGQSMSRQAEAERERRARIITADGAYQASKRLAAAANVMARDPAALQLRLLQTVVEVAGERNSTLVMPVPVELLRFFEKMAPDGQRTHNGREDPARDE